MNKQRFATIIGALGEAFRQTISPATILAYEWGLEGIPPEAIERAAKQAMRISKFMPTPAELRELAGEIPPQCRAVLAWDAFAKAMKNHFWHDSIDFDDPVINATIWSLGGWREVSTEWDTRPAHELNTWFRKEFERIYASLFRSGITPEQGRRLVGDKELTNRQLGYEDVFEVQRIVTGLPPLPLSAMRIGDYRKVLECVKGIE